MRMRRMLSGGEGYYHVISRITGQQFLMNAEEKDVLMRSMFNVAIFSGVEILTFALMDNHFHILVKVPRAHEVDEAGATASFKDGVLTLNLPKKAAAGGKRLTIS